MRFFTSIFLFLLIPLSAFSQTYEIGGFLGGANYIGDVGKTTYIAPNTPVFGALFKWNRSPRHSFRGSILFAKIEGNDNDSGDNRRKDRGYSFENNLIEISAGIEYTFWEFNMYSGKPANTPYIYTGLTYLRYSHLYKKSNDEFVEHKKSGSIAIPMVVGYKITVGRKFILGFEIGARYSFTDNLDGSNPDLSENNESVQFGNINNNDWYVFTGITLTYTFGRKPCYCNF